MPLALPNLDDRSFDDLAAEARAMIPALAPGWTNHNPSDPGITLVELFAWLTDVLIYRVNRVTDDNTRAFLRLLNGPGWTPSADLAGDIRATVLQLRQCDRAIVPADFEALASAADARVARAYAVARRDLTTSPDTDAPGNVSVIVLPAGGGAPPPDLIAAIAAYLDPRRLLTTRVHVVGPSLVSVGVALTLTLAPDALPATVRPAAASALAAFLDPLIGGADGTGWPFGRPVYLSEIVRLLDALPGIDHVESTPGVTELVVSDQSRLVRNESRDLVQVTLHGGELVQPAINPASLTLLTPQRP